MHKGTRSGICPSGKSLIVGTCLVQEDWLRGLVTILLCHRDNSLDPLSPKGNQPQISPHHISGL